MRLENQNYTITATVETMPSLSQFNIVYNLSNTNSDDFYMARVFRVSSPDGTSRSIALLDLLCSEYKPYAVLENNFLTVVLFDSIVRINLTTGLVSQYEECDNTGGLHEIHAIEDGYIIWGETDIFRYDPSLNRIWHFMGRDILVSLAANRHFWIEDQLIHCRDHLGYHYILNLNGTLLQEFLEFKNPENP